MSFWSEIKQRRITQIIVAYLAGGWMMLAVVDQVVDREVLPSVVYEVALTLYLFGIAAAVVIGWYHGEKGEQKAAPVELFVLAIITLGALGTSIQVVRSALQEDTLADALAASGLDLRSIGVLYFEDVSGDGSAGVIAEGITEGLISTLSQVQELDVVSRNGARQVRSLDVGIDSIARILDVGTVVDGSVDQEGDEIRVSVRVLEGETGIPLFRDSYTWPAENVNEVGSELAQEVANALREQLGEELRLREGRSQAPSSGAWLRMARAERLFRDGVDARAHGDAAAAAEAFARADAELLQTIETSPEWSNPYVLRGRIAYEHHLLAHSPDDVAMALGQAISLADEALELDPGNADAYELRGTVRYMRYLRRMANSEEALNEELTNARFDLESSRDFNPAQASALSTLSHLYYSVGDLEEAVLAARNAYRQDAFLTSANEVLWRLFVASYDLEDHRQASEWCAEGSERFPESYRYVQCRLWLMTVAGGAPNIEEAWRLLDELPALLPGGDAGMRIEAMNRIVVGGVIGISGMPDSAQAVWESAGLARAEDPEGEVMSIEAAMRSINGDIDGAIDLLQTYVVSNPGHFNRSRRLHWWWRPLQGNPDFENIRSLN